MHFASRFLYNENHAIVAWFSEGSTGEAEKKTPNVI